MKLLQYTRDYMVVQCPIDGKETMINACGSCPWHNAIDFANHTVSCGYEEGIETQERTTKRPIHYLKKNHQYVLCLTTGPPRAYVKDLARCIKCEFYRGLDFSSITCAFRPDINAEELYHENQRNAKTAEAGSPRTKTDG